MKTDDRPDEQQHALASHPYPAGLSRGRAKPSASAPSASALAAAKDCVDALLGPDPAAPVVVFSKSTCPSCDSVKALLGSMGQLEGKVRYVELDQRRDGGAVQAYLQRLTGKSCVPRVFIGDKLVGGSEDTATARRTGRLAEMLLDAENKPVHSRISREPEPEPEPEPQHGTERHEDLELALATALDLSRATVLQPGMVVLRGALTLPAQKILAETAFRRGDAGEVEGTAHGFQSWWTTPTAAPANDLKEAAAALAAVAVSTDSLRGAAAATGGTGQQTPELNVARKNAGRVYDAVRSFPNGVALEATSLALHDAARGIDPTLAAIDRVA